MAVNKVTLTKILIKFLNEPVFFAVQTLPDGDYILEMVGLKVGLEIPNGFYRAEKLLNHLATDSL